MSMMLWCSLFCLEFFKLIDYASVSCSRSMRCKKNDFPVKNKSSRNQRLWFGDQFECPTCEVSIVIGFGTGSSIDVFNEDLLAEALEFKQ